MFAPFSQLLHLLQLLASESGPRGPKNKALQGGFTYNQGLANVQMLALPLGCFCGWVFPLHSPPLREVPFHGQYLLAGHSLHPDTSSSVLLTSSPAPWGSGSTLPTGRLASTHLPCQLWEEEAIPNTFSSHHCKQLPLL